MKNTQLLSTLHGVNYLTSAIGETIQLSMLIDTDEKNQFIEKLYNEYIEQTELKHYLNYIVEVKNQLYIFATLELSIEQYDIDAIETLASQINSITEWNVYYEFECFDNHSEIVIAIPFDTSFEEINNVLASINKLWLLTD